LEKDIDLSAYEQYEDTYIVVRGHTYSSSKRGTRALELTGRGAGRGVEEGRTLPASQKFSQ